MRMCFRKHYSDARSPGLWGGGGQALGLFTACLEGFSWLQVQGQKVSMSPNEGDKRVPTVQEHNESSNVHKFLYFFLHKPKASEVMLCL